MFDSPSSIIVGLEIGTSNVCAVVGDLSPDGALNIIVPDSHAPGLTDDVMKRTVNDTRIDTAALFGGL